MKYGVSIEKELSEKLDSLVQSLPDMKVSKSEIIEAIIMAFFKSQLNHREKIRDIVTLSRQGKLK